MTMTYERYKELVPQETLEFTNKVLAYLHHYVTNTGSFEVPEYKKFPEYTDISRKFIVFLYNFASIRENRSFLDSQLFDQCIKLETVNENLNYSRLFARFSDLFLINKFDEEYLNLSPTQLVLEITRNFKKSCECPDLWKNFLFSGKTTLDSFVKSFEEYYNSEVFNYQYHQSSTEYFGLSKNVVSYLGQASRIMKDLVEHYGCNSIITSAQKDSVPLALLLAAAYYEDVEKDEYGLTKQTTLLELLEEKGIVLRPGNSSTILEYYPSEVKYEPDVRTSSLFFRKYYNEGIYALKERSNVTVPGIIENVLRDNGLNETPILQRIIPLQYQGTFEGLEKSVDFEFRRDERIKELDYTAPLLSDTCSATKNYLMTATKIYTIIKRKMESEKHNSDVLMCDDDADTLSLFLAAFFMKLEDVDVVTFYQRHGITLDRILDFLKINITQEEIDTTTLNRKLLMDKFNRYVVEGVNNGLRLMDVRPENICDNLCDRKFNKSIIMEEIYNSLSDGEYIGCDFLDTVKTEINECRKKEEDIKKASVALQKVFDEMERKEAAEKLLDGMDDETVRFLKRVAIIFKAMKSTGAYCEPITQSILLALGNTGPDDYVWRALRIKGYSAEKYASSLYSLNFDLKWYIENNNRPAPEEFDIRTLYAYFKKFIIDKDTGKKRSIIEMVKFIPDFCDSTILKKLYSDQYINEDIFRNIENELEDAKKAKEEEDKESKVFNRFHPYCSFSHVLEEAIRILEYLRVVHFDAIPEEDLPDLTILLALSKRTHKYNVGCREFFERNGLYFDKICTLLKINMDELSSFNQKVKFYPHLEDYKKYFEGLGDSRDHDFSIYIKKFFHNNHALDTVIEGLNEASAVQQINRQKLEVEVINEKPYFDTLSISEKRDLLEAKEVEPLKYNKWDSLLTYGDSLLEHSRAICDEFDRLEKESISERKMNNVYRSLARVCRVDVSHTKDKNDLLAAKINRVISARALTAKALHIRSKKMPIIKDELPNLDEYISKTIEVLTNEIDAYHKLFEYVALFRRKNIEYCNNANNQKMLLDAVHAVCPQTEITYAYDKMADTKFQSLLKTIGKLENVNELTKAHVTSICNAITKNINDINALMVAQNVLIPLVRRYSANPELPSDDLIISNSVMRLLNGILTRNDAYTAASLNLLEHTLLPGEDINKIKMHLANSKIDSGSVLRSLDTDNTEPGSNVPVIEFPKSGMIGPRVDGTLPQIIPVSNDEEPNNGPTKHLTTNIG